MSYYLKHYFDPDFNYQHLAPVANFSGAVEHRYLGYVQNVCMGQVLAEFVPADSEADPNPKYIMERPVFPLGPNCVVDPENPLKLLAERNGYVFYLDGKICVKTFESEKFVRLTNETKSSTKSCRIKLQI